MRKNLEKIKVQISCYLRNYYFSLNHPTGWAESISGNGVCLSVCMYVITSKMINKTARRLSRPL